MAARRSRPRLTAPLLATGVVLSAVAVAFAGQSGQPQPGSDEESDRAAPAAWPIVLSLEPYLSIESGADFTSTAVGLLGDLEAKGFRFADRRRAVGIPLRLVRTVVLDHPLAYWFVVLQHEAFGHGGRAREFGSDAGVHMGSPWSGRSSYATFSTEGRTADELLRVYTGGSESNGWAATLLEREVVGGRPMGSWSLLYLFRSRLVTSDYVLRTTPDPVHRPAAFHSEWAGGGDVANYLGYLATIHDGDPGISPDGASATVVGEYRRLRRQAYWNALDPGAWLALWALGQRIVRGDAAEPVSLPTVGGRRVLPVLSAEWLPEGGAISVETIIGPRQGGTDRSGPRWISFTVRRGRGPAGSFGAVGAATERLWEVGRIRLGGEAEIWTRPEHGLGGGGRVTLRVTRGRLRDLFLDVGAKSDGHWPGRPAGVGPFVRLGLRYAR